MTAPEWRKSSHSHGENTDCVEVARISTTIGVRDSKDPDGPRLTLGLAAFAGLLDGVKAGRFEP